MFWCGWVNQTAPQTASNLQLTNRTLVVRFPRRATPERRQGNQKAATRLQGRPNNQSKAPSCATLPSPASVAALLLPPPSCRRVPGGSNQEKNGRGRGERCAGEGVASRGRGTRRNNGKRRPRFLRPRSLGSFARRVPCSDAPRVRAPGPSSPAARRIERTGGKGNWG